MTAVAASTALVTRSPVSITADPKRVLARLFVPGQEHLIDLESRSTGVLARILALPEDAVESTLRDVRQRWDSRHRDLPGIMAAHYEVISHRIPDVGPLSEARKGLIGAVFTHEFSNEGAALFNPSPVLHPDQSDVEDGAVRFVMSVRAVGEGHLSSVGFRTGVLGPGQALQLDDPGPHIEGGTVVPPEYDRALFAARLEEEGADAESTRFLLGTLPQTFHQDDLWASLSALSGQRLTRQGAVHTDELARRIARCTYDVEFSPDSGLAERVLWPEAPTESVGIEDVRLVRFVEDDGGVSYRGTYTAFDGAQIAPQTIETLDFRTFRMSQLAGPTAKNKGFALFPRRIAGRYVALSRWDRESNTVTTSADGRVWDEGHTLHTPGRTWDIIQSGNCGSPIETEAGWLVLTHGVGPMREYAIGALLLDLHDPTRVIGDLGEPLLCPTEEERDGYVPNVVYSCGGLLHGDQLLLPYGASDASIRFAFVDVPGLLDRMTR
ncbi:MAG: glycoside hydrolase family 130 protein [Actinomycetota bacterium]|nr:glycoside hydrolase family 130 protein [Actinomycetota bacterium]